MQSNEIYNILARTDPFEILEENVLKDLSDKVETKIYPPNTYVFKQKTPSLDVLFVVASGLVEITVTDDRGMEAVIGMKRPYDFFGESVVLSQQQYPDSARAKERLVCCFIPRKELERLIYSYPEFSGFFNVLLAERMRILYKEMADERSYCNLALSDSESEFFRRRVSEIMAYPVITCRADDLVTNASKIMAEKNINAIVALDRNNRPRGILTEKNLVVNLIARQMYSVENCRVENVMRCDLAEIEPNAFTGQALVAMIRGKTKHLIVKERGNLVGIISMEDLAKTRSTGALLLTKDIESQPNLDGLILISREIPKILKGMVAENAKISEIFDVMSELRERLTRRVIQLSEERMRRNGWGGPPVEYCWINMGSAARFEQALGTDQDNAVLYADPEENQSKQVNAYFEHFAKHITQSLTVCGFGACDQGTVAVHPQWRKSLSQWIKIVGEWSDLYISEHTRMFFTFLDYHMVWGNMALAETFREILFDRFNDYINQWGSTGKGPEYHAPIRFLGTFQTESRGRHMNEMNLKTSAIIPMVNAIRILAVTRRIYEVSSLERIRRLTEAGVMSLEQGDFFEKSFEIIMGITVRENLKKLESGVLPDNYIDPYSLRKRERMDLKEALNGVSQLLELVNEQFPGIRLVQVIYPYHS